LSLINSVSATPIDDLAHSAWLGISQAHDAQDTIQALAGQTFEWLVIDHYALDARWESAMRDTAKRIMAIDDLADRQHDCDMLLDQNFYADMQTRYNGKVPAHCQLLLGPRYALLREEFRQLRKQVKPHTGAVKRILVFFGGMDADNYTDLAIKALAEIQLEEIQVDVVIGAQHPCRAEIETSCITHGFICHVQTDKMAELMAAADLAIGAGGTAIWERCCLGLPTLSICVADNQQKQLADAAKEGLLYAPVFDSDVTEVFKKHITALIENPYLRRLISYNAMQIVDGLGVLRIVGNLGCNTIEMKNANEEDSPKLFEWRNHPKIRLVSRNAAPITWENHQKWFEAVKASQNKVLLIGQIDKEPVGVVRFDKQQDHAEISIYLVPDANFTGQGRNLLLSAEQWLKVNQPEIKRIRASVLGGNESSQRLFAGSDYRIEITHYLKDLYIK
jgi:UDP-2,4-diacetamido-2,4,6-trideoxy-beta-L-altropyranose hydrolase